MTWREDLRIEDLPETFQQIAQEKGIEFAIDLAEYFGGQQVYFPQVDTIFKKAKERFIVDRFNGINHTELSRATGLSEREVYEVLKGERIKAEPTLFT